MHAQPVQATEPINSPPEDLPIHRVFTGPDGANFCRRVSAALKMGYPLHGAPALTFNGKEGIVAQVVVWLAAKAAGPWRQAHSCPETLRMPTAR